MDDLLQALGRRCGRAGDQWPLAVPHVFTLCAGKLRRCPNIGNRDPEGGGDLPVGLNRSGWTCRSQTCSISSLRDYRGLASVSMRGRNISQRMLQKLRISVGSLSRQATRYVATRLSPRFDLNAQFFRGWYPVHYPT
jgi:hypothetical protein